MFVSPVVIDGLKHYTSPCVNMLNFIVETNKVVQKCLTDEVAIVVVEEEGNTGDRG